MKKAIVTGANGFVGYWLIRELQRNGVAVTAVIKDEDENISALAEFPDVVIVYCDLSEFLDLPTRIPARDFDVMYHLAWVSAGGPGRADYAVQLNNVKYACDAVAAAAAIGCRKILFAGTVTERIAENVLNLSAKAVNNIYGVCKHMTHCLVDIESRRQGIEYVWMQFSNLFGPYSINGNIVGYTIKELLSGREATFGPSNQPYDLLYIEDLARAAYLLGSKATKRSCYYIGSGDVRILSEYLMEIGEEMELPGMIRIGFRPDDGTRYAKEWFDISPLVEDTGYKPSFSFANGLRKTVDWMKTTL
ncbi:MAG: NAD(P)-dependent oxidoreductase [Bacteroidales bacterium]|nr:NAD(P)-dependent oxidoreductase [Bacteroidales bacterium]